MSVECQAHQDPAEQVADTISTMGCLSTLWSWLTCFWDCEPYVNSEPSTPNERRSLIPIRVTSCAGETAAHQYEAPETPSRPSLPHHKRTSSLTIPKVQALPSEETDVSQSSLRKLGRGGSLDPGTPQDTARDASYTGAQFPDMPDAVPTEILEEDVADSSHNLEAQLWDARIEWPPGQNRYFIPADNLRQLLTIGSISRELWRCEINLPHAQTQRLSETILNTAPRLFAILACLGLSKCVTSFLDEGLDDDDLPLVRAEKRGVISSASNFELRGARHQDVRINCMRKWTRLNIMSFYNYQWWMLAPLFWKASKVRHWELEDNCVLPFIEDREKDQATESGFSWVWPIRVHPAHHNFYATHNPLLALKKLHSADKRDFLLEAEMLKAFSNHKHPHLIKLLWTFEMQGRYYLVFPFAKLNLRKYWQQTACPEFSFEKGIWLLRQCKCIASGLMAIHNYRTTNSVGTGKPMPESKSPGDNLSPDIMPVGDERMYGRHGDIKPENILWSDQDTADEDGNDDQQGILLIADFGLMEFHGKLTRSLVKPQGLKVSPTYEPPERLLSIKISRAYDIWSLGCVYLEFITWLVAGNDYLDRFPEVRGKTNPSGINNPINDDTYYSLVNGNPPRAIVRESVVEWILDLHETPKCSKFIHEFLDLVSKEMLVVDASKRIHCGPLNARMRKMLQKAEKDRDYLIKPNPRTPRKRNAVAVEMRHTMENRKQSQPPSPVDVVVPFNRSERSTAANFGSPPSSLERRPFSPPPA